MYPYIFSKQCNKDTTSCKFLDSLVLYTVQREKNISSNFKLSIHHQYMNNIQYHVDTQHFLG